MCWSDALLLTSIMILPSRCVFPSCVLFYFCFCWWNRCVNFLETSGCTCSSRSSSNMIIDSSHVENVQRSPIARVKSVDYQMISLASCILLVKQTMLTVCIKVASSALTDANICRGCTFCSAQTLPLYIYRSFTCASATVDEDAQTRGKVRLKFNCNAVCALYVCAAMSQCELFE